MDVIWTLVGFILTLLVFSYLFGDNPLFRLAVYLFIGVTAGYLLVIVFYQVIWPDLILPMLSGDTTRLALAVVPLVLGLLLLTKLFPRFAGVGSISTAYLVGVGAAVAIGGAVLGTLFGQMRGTIDLFDIQAAINRNINPIWSILQGLIFLAGTIGVLAYFQYGGFGRKRSEEPPATAGSPLSKLGQVFIAIALGAVFAGVYAAAVTALIERLDFLKNVITSFML